MITCSVCGNLNPVDALVCEDCGSDLSDSPDLVGFDDEEDNEVFDSNDDGYDDGGYDDYDDGYDDDYDDGYYDE